MSQETIIDENYRMPEPVRVGEETGSLTRVFQQLVFTVDHKKLGLMYIGAGLLFFVIAGFLMPRTAPVHSHLLVALAVWAGYAGLLAIKTLRGLTGRKLALSAVAMFILSLVVFARI